MKIGFIGLGNVGAKLATSLLRKGFDLTVLDLDKAAVEPLQQAGAKVAENAKSLAEDNDVIITCLPSPKISAEVLEA
jgi:3-hydroxyisobutyrate dehydrogenase